MSRELQDAVRDLARAYQAALLYPEGHPAVRSAVAESWAHLDGVLSREGGLTLRVGGDQLVLAGEEGPLEAGPALQSLTTTLHELDVSAIELRAGIPQAELVQLVDALIQARREEALGKERLRLLSESGLEHVRLEFIDYGALSFREGLKEEAATGQEPGEDVWLGLFEMISGDVPELPPPPPEAFARDFSQILKMREGEGIHQLREVIRKAHEESRRVDADAMDRTRLRVLRFLEALSPDLRSDLLRIDPQRPEQMLGLVSDLAEDLQVPDLLRSLEALDDLEGPVPGNLIPLLSKLVRMSESRDDEGEEIRARLDDWGLSALPVNMGVDELREAVSEVLQRRGNLNPNPEAYSRMLEELLRGRLEGAGESSSADLYEDPNEPDGLRLRALEIALRLLRGELTELSAGPLARVSLSCGLLLEGGRLESLREAVAAAVEVSRREDASENLKLASRGFLETFRQRETIDGILDHGKSLGGMSGTGLYLLGLGGRESTRAVVEVLEGDAESAFADDLAEYLDKGGTTVLVAIVRERLGEDEHRLNSTARWLRKVGVEKARPVLEAMFEHPSPPVRRRALVELCQRVEEPMLVKSYLSRGLQDEDRQVAEQGFRLLLTMDNRLVSDLLIEILRNVIEGRERSTYWAMPLANRMLRGGSTEGLDRLVSLLGDLRWSWKTRNGRLALALSKVLDPFAGKPEVATVLRQIRYSPAGLMAHAQASIRRRRKGDPY